eukprot:CAMPEP_0116057196 /NCGR_PEP_ID=MMETSP0322-20121206/4463_1 /TAXON_ID=163516 /ORGANISM="Leptocylindrus danicus var. apora, Strain B651" /LENGTH=271 /DNA_ID=CAMNT_0003541153 /DNA_START=39 /DNA_END=854 /DNA_ORIENTATION=+
MIRHTSRPHLRPQPGDENSILSRGGSTTKSIAFANNSNSHRNHTAKTVNFGKTPLQKSSNFSNVPNKAVSATPKAFGRRALGDISNRKSLNLENSGNNNNKIKKGVSKQQGTTTKKFSSRPSSSYVKVQGQPKSQLKNVSKSVAVVIDKVEENDEFDYWSDIEQPAGRLYDPRDDPPYVLPEDDECAIEIRKTEEVITMMNNFSVNRDNGFFDDEKFEQMLKNDEKELEAFTCEYEDPLLQHEDYWGGYDYIQFHEDASMFHDVLLSDSEE